MSVPRFSKPIITIAVLAFAFFITCFAPAKAADAPAPSGQTAEAVAFIQGIGDRAISILSDKAVTPEQANKTFHAMLRDDFDIDLLGKYALGAAVWKTLNDSQKQQYNTLFEKLVVQLYNSRFRLYHGETFKAVGATAEDERDTYVNGLIFHNDSRPPVKVDWRVRKKDGRFQVIDVIVEGVSMTVTQHSEFSSVLQKNGGDFATFLKDIAVDVAE